MDVYDISNITDIKEDVLKTWTIRQRTKASTCRTLYKILECEMSVLGAKLPFLEGKQIKCIALNWIGIPTIMGHIPNSETIGYLIPAQNKRKVMTMIRLLFSKRKPTKTEEKVLNELSEMIFRSCTSLLKNSTCRSSTLAAETNERALSNSSMILTPVNDRPEEQINPLPEEQNSPEIAGKTIFKKPQNKMNHKRQLFSGPGCALSEKRRKKGIDNSNLTSSDLSGDSLQLLRDETGAEIAVSGDILTGGTTDSENIIVGTPIKSLSPIVSKGKPHKQNIANQKLSVPEELHCDSEITQQNLVSDPTENNLLENSAMSLTQETSSEKTNAGNTGADSLMPDNKQNTKAIADVESNKIILDGFCGFDDIDLENHTEAANIHENKTMATENEEPALIQYRELQNTVTLRTVSTTVTSGNDHSDLLTQSQEVVPSKNTNNDLLNSDKNAMLPSEFYRPTEVRKHTKVSATVLLLVEKGSSLATTPDASEVNTVTVEVKESSHGSCVGTPPTPSSRAVSQELGHQSPIQYLSLEPYSSEEEEAPGPREETALEKQDSQDLLVDLFSPVTSDTHPTARPLLSAEAPGGQTILSLDEQEPVLASV